jgi:hypothetical protein
MAFMESAKRNFDVIKIAMAPVINLFREMRANFKKLLESIRGGNKATSTARERWEKFGEILRYTLIPLKVTLKALSKMFEWISIGVTWIKKMYEKFKAFRFVIDQLLKPLRMLRDAFDWINQQLDKNKHAQLKLLSKRLGVEMQRLNTLKKGSDEYNKQFKEIEKIAKVYTKLTGREPLWFKKLKGEDETADGEGGLTGNLTGGAGGTGGGGAGTGQGEITDSPYKITGSAPKVFNLKVEKLIGIENLSSTTMKESTEEMKESILTALMEAIVDVQTNVK